MILEALASGLGGGILRMVPEVLKWMDRKDERKHELDMMDKEMTFAQVKGQIVERQTEAAISVAELDAIKAASDEQSKTAVAAGWFVSALSALVRPVVTYWFTVMYSAVKIISMTMAIDQGAPWKEVLVNSWTADDRQIFFMILGFWFVGRIWDKVQDSRIQIK